MKNISLETYDFYGQQYNIYNYSGLKYSNHYSDKGSGFGYCSFVLPREIGRNYLDISYGYQVKVRKGIGKILYHGLIVKIDESSGDDGDSINISCVGFSTLFTYDMLNFIASDNRVEKWTKGCSRDGDYRPDKFDFTKEWSDKSARDRVLITLAEEIKPKMPLAKFEETVYRMTLQLDYINSNNKSSENIFIDIDELLRDVNNNKIMYSSTQSVYDRIYNAFNVYKNTRVKKGFKIEVKDGMSFGCLDNDCTEFKEDVQEYAYYEYYSNVGNPISRLYGNMTIEYPKNAYFRVEISNEHGDIFWKSDGKVNYKGTSNKLTYTLLLDTFKDYKGAAISKDSFKIIVKFICNKSGIIYTNIESELNEQIMIYSPCYVSIEHPIVYCKYKDQTGFESAVSYNIFKRLIDFMHDNYNFNNTYSYIDVRDSELGYLENGYFDTDMTIEDIFNTIVSYGDNINKPVAYGVNFNDRLEIFVNNYDLTNIKYVVDNDSLPETSYSGDVTESYNVVFATIETSDGVFRTNDLKDISSIRNLGGIYKRKKLDLGSIPEDKALLLLTTNLNEHSEPKMSSNLSVKGNLKYSNGIDVPFEEVQSGAMIQINTFLARESNGLDKRQSKSTFFLVSAEIDIDGNSVTLTPSSGYSKFENYMAKLAKLTN